MKHFICFFLLLVFCSNTLRVEGPKGLDSHKKNSYAHTSSRVSFKSDMNVKGTRASNTDNEYIDNNITYQPVNELLSDDLLIKLCSDDEGNKLSSSDEDNELCSKEQVALLCSNYQVMEHDEVWVDDEDEKTGTSCICTLTKICLVGVLMPILGYFLGNMIIDRIQHKNQLGYNTTEETYNTPQKNYNTAIKIDPSTTGTEPSSCLSDNGLEDNDYSHNGPNGLVLMKGHKCFDSYRGSYCFEFCNCRKKPALDNSCYTTCNTRNLPRLPSQLAPNFLRHNRDYRYPLKDCHLLCDMKVLVPSEKVKNLESYKTSNTILQCEYCHQLCLKRCLHFGYSNARCLTQCIDPEKDMTDNNMKKILEVTMDSKKIALPETECFNTCPYSFDVCYGICHENFSTADCRDCPDRSKNRKKHC